MSLFYGYLKSLTEDGLYLLYQDASNRIGSHFIGGNPDPNYIHKQESIIAAIQDELKDRRQRNQSNG